MGFQNVLFSIIVPVYNVENYLEECINSVLNQSYRDYELILVNDGSNDDSAHICEEYKKRDSRIKVIHKKNEGLVSARKAGISIATGTYAVCVDSDDWIAKNYLLELYQIITTYQPEIICFNYYEVNENGCIECRIPFRKGIYLREDILREINPYAIQTVEGTAFPPAIWGKAYKMDLYRTEQLFVDNRIKIGEDAACTIPCILKADSIYILDKALYYYRRNNSSMTKNKKPFSWDVPELIEFHLRNRVDKNELDLQQQISRRTVHALINVVKTQFYCEKKYGLIAKDIEREMSRPVYQNALKKSTLKRGSIISICRFFLKRKIYFPFYLLSKIR